MQWVGSKYSFVNDGRSNSIKIHLDHCDRLTQRLITFRSLGASLNIILPLFIWVI